MCVSTARAKQRRMPGTHTWYVLLCFTCAVMFASGVRATKDLPVSEPFDTLILDGIRCDVCELTMANTVKAVAELVNTQKAQGQTLTSTQVDNIVDRVCIPFVPEGEWLRRVELVVSGTTGNKTFRLEPLEYYSDCKRTCTSLQELCEELMDHKVTDGLGAHIVQRVRDLHEDYDRIIAELNNIVCDLHPKCTDQYQQRRTLEKALSASNKAFLNEIENDSPTVIEDAEREVEAMLYKMRSKGRKATVLTRKELKQLRSDIIRNNRAAAEKLDPSLAGVSDETFREIRRALAGKGYYYHSGREESAAGEANTKQDEPDL